MTAESCETSRGFRLSNGSVRVCARSRKYRRILASMAMVAFFISSQIFCLETCAEPRKKSNASLDTLGFALLLRPETSSNGSEFRDTKPAIDAELERNPDDSLYLRMKAEQLMKTGKQEKAVEILKKLIKTQLDKKTRYAAPYIGLAYWYRKSKQRAALLPIVKEMVSRFPDNRFVLSEVQSHNRVLKNPEVASALEEALKKLKNEKIDKSLRAIKPPHPKPLKPGICYQLTVNTVGFPKFKMLLLNDRCVADSGVAKYFVSPPTYERVLLFNPESKNYAATSVMEMMQHHCSVTANRSYDLYSSVRRIGSEKVNGHVCSIYQCQYPGEDNYDKIYLSDSMQLEKPLADTLSEVCQTPYSGCVPLKAFRVIEGHSCEILNVHFLVETKAEPTAFKLPEKAHKVESINDVILDNSLMESLFMAK